MSKNNKQALISDVELTTMIVNSTILGAQTSDTILVYLRNVEAVADYIASQRPKYENPFESYSPKINDPLRLVSYHRRMMKR